MQSQALHSPNLLSACDAREAVETGLLSSEELVEGCLDRIEELEQSIGAWAHLDKQLALDYARQADKFRSRGLPIGLKGVYHGQKYRHEYNDYFGPFLLGWPLEWTEIIIIFVPIFLPMLDTFQVDPLFFGILVALNLQTSFLTPPMAMAAYYLKGVAPPYIQLMDIFRGIMPYLAIIIFSMVLLYNFPGIALWLPVYFFG